MEKKKEYNISIKKGALVFTTTSFRAEEGSALHSGIYNRELTASLASGAVMVALAIIIASFKVRLSIPHYIAGALLFAVLMVLFRYYVFFEEFLKTVIDKGRGELTVFMRGFRNRKETVPLESLRSVRMGITVFAPSNPDGVGVVKQISAQHGMAVPGLGEPKEFHSVVLEFRDGSDVTVFSSEERSEAHSVVNMMKNFIGGAVAQAD
jgi:hypothetical protein